MSDSCIYCTDYLSKLVEGDYSFISWLCGIEVSLINKYFVTGREATIPRTRPFTKLEPIRRYLSLHNFMYGGKSFQENLSLVNEESTDFRR